jgi:hypothetical protein
MDKLNLHKTVLEKRTYSKVIDTSFSMTTSISDEPMEGFDKLTTRFDLVKHSLRTMLSV